MPLPRAALMLRNTPRTVPRVINQGRSNRNSLRTIYPKYTNPSKFTPVKTTFSEQGLLGNWQPRISTTLKTHLLYPSLIYAYQNLLTDSPKPVHIGGAVCQSTRGSSSLNSRGLTGFEASHLNLGSAKCNGRSLVLELSNYLKRTPNASNEAPNLCRFVVTANALEGDITFQPAFINRAESLIETQLHKSMFLFMDNLGTEIRPDFLCDATRFVHNLTLQKISGGAINQVVEDLINADNDLLRQAPEDPYAACFDGEPDAFFKALCESGVVRPSTSTMFKEVSPTEHEITGLVSTIVREVGRIQKSDTGNN